MTGYSPQGSKESDTTEQLHFHYFHQGRVRLSETGNSGEWEGNEMEFSEPSENSRHRKGPPQELLSEEQSHYQNLSQEAARTGINSPASRGLPDKIEDVHSLI